MRLPDFLVGGAMKCGTTSLILNLRQHPDIDGPSEEVRFFDVHWDKGWDWYGGRFARFHHAKLVGEKSPFYITYEACQRRIKTRLPRVKWLLLLRNPIDRWASHWRMTLLTGSLQKEFAHSDLQPENAEALLDYQFKIEKENGTIPPMLLCGRYSDQLHGLLRLFPFEQIHIGLTERVSADPTSYYQSLCDFLGVEYMNELGAIRTNIHNHASHPLPVPLSVRHKLQSYYRQQTDNLRKLLNDSLNEWDEPIPLL